MNNDKASLFDSRKIIIKKHKSNITIPKNLIKKLDIMKNDLSNSNIFNDEDNSIFSSSSLNGLNQKKINIRKAITKK